MKTKLIFRIILISVLFFLTNPGQSQPIDFNNFQVLKSSGALPQAVITALSLSNGKAIDKEVASGTKKTAQQKKTFLMKNDCDLFQLIRNGNILFGDPISNYVEKVAKKLLKDNPQLFEELHIYTIKYPAINAFSNNNGFIFVDIGLIANLETEAELAFVLAHEISHYIKKHPMEAHLENLKIFKGKSAYRFKSINQKLDLLGKRSRNIEFEADSIGISLFIASSYNTSAIDKSLERLHYSYIPFSDEPFDIGFFNEGNFKVPECYFLDTCSKKSIIKDTYDENYSHPNIFKRKARAKTILEGKPSKAGKDFLVSESEFLYIREIARFELVHLNVRNEEYGDAIYNAYALLKQYPDNEYLELCIAKSMYGLTKYKNEEKYFYVAEPYEKAEGQSQQVHYFLKQMNRKQLNVLAIKYLRRMKKIYPSAEFLDKLETDLINEMIIKNGIDFEMFKDADKFKNEERLNPSISKRELQKKNENFYFMAFRDEAANDTGFINKCLRAQYKKVAEEQKSRISLKEKDESEKRALDNIRLRGVGNNIGNLIVIDPYIQIDNEKIEKEYLQYDVNKKELDLKVIESAKSSGLKPTMISSRDININNDTDKYNELCTYREMLLESMSHDIDCFYPVGASYFSADKGDIKNILCYFGLFDDTPNDQYYISFIDLNSGKTLFWNEKKVQKGNLDKIKKYLTEDFLVLTK